MLPLGDQHTPTATPLPLCRYVRSSSHPKEIHLRARIEFLASESYFDSARKHPLLGTSSGGVHERGSGRASPSLPFVLTHTRPCVQNLESAHLHGPPTSQTSRPPLDHPCDSFQYSRGTRLINMFCSVSVPVGSRWAVTPRLSGRCLAKDRLLLCERLLVLAR